MAIFTAIMVFLLFSSGAYLVMRRNIFEVLLGVTLLSHGVNVFLISMGGWTRESQPPILKNGGDIVYADALPQALILTAIVIGFAIVAYLVVLVLRGYEET
jgi:multisubunit Na+/H+ antiporter MnhC subunit